MIKIFISGTKGGYGYKQFCNNLTFDEINEIQHLLSDGRSFVRFNTTGVEYYMLGFSKNFKIFMMSRSCLEVTGSNGGYISISLLIPHDKRYNGSVLQLLTQLQNVYFQEYVRDLRVLPGIENIGFFTSVINSVPLVSDDFGGEIDWGCRTSNETGMVSYVSLDELDRIFAQPYLHPFDAYAKVALMDRAIVGDIGRFSGQFYARPNMIETISAPISYQFAPYSPETTDIMLMEFRRYGKIDGELGLDIRTNYANGIKFFNKTRITIKITRTYYKDVKIDSTVEEAINTGNIILSSDGKLFINMAPVLKSFIFNLRPQIEGLNETVQYKYRINGGDVASSSFVRNSEELNFSLIVELKVDNQDQYFKVINWKNIIANLNNFNDIGTDIFINLYAVTYLLDKNSNKGGQVKFLYEGKLLKLFDFNPEIQKQKSCSIIVPDIQKITGELSSSEEDYNNTKIDDVKKIVLLKKHDDKRVNIFIELELSEKKASNIETYNQEVKNRIKFELINFSEIQLVKTDEDCYFQVPYNRNIDSLKLIACINNGLNYKCKIEDLLYEYKENNLTFLKVKFRVIPYRLSSDSGFGEVIWKENGSGNELGRHNFVNSKDSFILILPIYLKKDLVIWHKNEQCKCTRDCKILIPKTGQTTSSHGSQVNNKANPGTGQERQSSSTNSANTNYTPDNEGQIITINLTVDGKSDFEFTDGQFGYTSEGMPLKSNINNTIELNTKDLKSKGRIKIEGEIVENKKIIAYSGEVIKGNTGYSCDLTRCQKPKSKWNIGKKIKKRCEKCKLIIGGGFGVIILLFFFFCIKLFFWRNNETKNVRILYKFERMRLKDDSVNMNVTNAEIKYFVDGEYKIAKAIDSIKDDNKVSDTLIGLIPEDDFKKIVDTIEVVSKVHFSGKNGEVLIDTTIVDTTTYKKFNISSNSTIGPINIKREETRAEKIQVERMIADQQKLKEAKIDSLVNIYKCSFDHLQLLNVSFAHMKQYKELFDGKKLKDKVDPLGLEVDSFWVKVESKKRLINVRQHISYSISFFNSIKDSKKEAKWNNVNTPLVNLLGNEAFTKFFSPGQNTLFETIKKGNQDRLMKYDFSELNDGELTFKFISEKY